MAALLISCIMACSHSSNNTSQNTNNEDDCPILSTTDADRFPKIILSITSDSLVACHDNFNGKDDNPLILDISNPGFNDFMNQWFNSMDSTEVAEINANVAVHITVHPDVKDETVDKVKAAVKSCGVEKISISNFDIEN